MTEPQEPAQNVTKLKNVSGDYRIYRIDCDCLDPDHGAVAWIEVESDSDIKMVSTTFYVETRYHSFKGFFSRLRDAWRVLRGDPLVRDTGLILDEQAAINFSHAVEQSVKNLKKSVD